MRKSIYCIILVLLLYAFFEIFSFVSLFLLEKIRHVTYSPMPTRSLTETQKASIHTFVTGTTKYLEYSSTLGWTIKKNGQASIYRANAQGIRANRDWV